jgi:hypothetical protein
MSWQSRTKGPKPILGYRHKTEEEMAVSSNPEDRLTPINPEAQADFERWIFGLVERKKKEHLGGID